MKPLTTHPFTTDLLTSKDFFWNCRTADDLADYHHNIKARQLFNPTDSDIKALLAIIQNEKKLASLIVSTVTTMDGWSSPEKGCVLAALILAMRPKVCVEIGVFAGRSLIPMAMAIKHGEIPGKVIGIDPYSAEASAKGEQGENEKWWGQLDHKAIHDKFQNFVQRFDLAQQVQLLRQTSDAVTPMPCDLIHIDGNHSDQAVRDAERFGPTVRLGGIVVCDDLMWVGGGVLRAVDVLEDLGFAEMIRVTDNGECWNVMQRIKV
jgi:predicted O-methyltransferase YrrM